MAKVSPFHSKLPSDGAVYHNNSKCTEGNNIEKKNRVSGTGGRPLCSHCARLT
jgi:competence protein ComGC